MDADQTSLQYLKHFDGLAGGDDVDLAAAATIETNDTPRRGVGWVLQWAAALAVLCYATTVLAEFGYCVAAEQLLARAARAGALEAMLPRATVGSVEQSVWRRLAGHVASPSDLKFALLQNGMPMSKNLRPSGGDELIVTLAMPAQAVMPGWLRALTGWRGDTPIEARAARTMPGRKLLVSGTR
jgi:hypothetical protein